MTTPKHHITMGEATLPLNFHLNPEGFIWITDAQGYYVLSLAPLQVAALVEIIAKVSEPPPWLGQPISKEPA